MILGGNADWRKKIQESLELHFGSGQFRPSEFKTGPIASSNHLIRNPHTLNRWRDIARMILAVEMESAGVYEATQRVDRQYPVMAIRGISDIVGLERDRSWTAYACQTAAAFAHSLVMCGALALPARHSISRRGAILMGVGVGTGVVVGGISLAWRKRES